MSYSEGFKGGGFDPRGSATSAPISNAAAGRTYQDIYNYLSFDPETVKSYEVGYKGSAFDRRLTWALAGFYADSRTCRCQGSVRLPDQRRPELLRITTNAAKARIKGVELETTARIAAGLCGGGIVVQHSRHARL